jgi:hypothetical protein
MRTESGLRSVKGEAHGAISLPPTLREKPRRMGHPAVGADDY